MNESISQGVSINENGTPTDTSAMLDVSANYKGFLAPRMTEVQHNAIYSPSVGLLVYQTDGKAKGFYFYTGSNLRVMDIHKQER